MFRHISENIEKLKDTFVCQPMGVSTGFDDLNKAIWGMQPKRLITVGGRPAMGKTGIMADITLAASKEAPVGIFSLEMDYEQLQARLSANLSNLNFRNVMAGDVTAEEQDRFLEAGQVIKELPIFVDDQTPGYLGIEPYWLKQRSLKLERTIDYRIKHMIKEKGCKVILIDYLQLILHTNAAMKDRRVTVGKITEQLRDYAKQYNFCCILLCQLRRFDQARYGSGKKRTAPMPTMDDLKESGEIENHSDVVMLLHRPDYYDEKRELQLTSNIIEDNALLMIRKNRNGPTGNIPVQWYSSSMSYRDFRKEIRGEF